MASTTFLDNQTVIYAAWLNDVNNAVYNGIFVSPSITATSMICNGTASGAGFTNLITNALSAPGPIGTATPSTGAFTTLTLTNPLGVIYGGTGVTTSTGSGANVLGTSPTLTTPTVATLKSAATNTATVFQDSAGTQIGTLARAWVSFDGQATPPTINASFNVSSVTRSSTGTYVVNFTNALPNTSYAVNVTASRDGNYSVQFSAPTLSTSAVTLNTAVNQAGTASNSNYVSVIIF